MNVEQPGPDTFLGLSDVPHSFAGFGSDFLAVKATEDGIEFTPITSLVDTFETVSKNLKSYPATLVYTGENLTSILYDLGGGMTVTKTLNYTAENLTTVVLSGNIPSGIDTVKTLSYSGEDLTGVTYS